MVDKREAIWHKRNLKIQEERESHIPPSNIESQLINMCFLKPIKRDNFYDKDQLAKGIEVEKEHTGNEDLAKIITKHHLNEFPNYYDGLDLMEEALKCQKKEGKTLKECWIKQGEKLKEKNIKYSLYDVRDEFGYWAAINDEKKRKSPYNWRSAIEFTGKKAEVIKWIEEKQNKNG